MQPPTPSTAVPPQTTCGCAHCIDPTALAAAVQDVVTITGFNVKYDHSFGPHTLMLQHDPTASSHKGRWHFGIVIHNMNTGKLRFIRCSLPSKLERDPRAISGRIVAAVAVRLKLFTAPNDAFLRKLSKSLRMVAVAPPPLPK